MAITERYLDVELASGLNDGTSEANAWQTWAAAVSGMAADQRLNVKNPSSRFTVGGAAAFTTVGFNTTPIHLRGYGATIGDGVAAQMENFRFQTSGENWLVEGLDILNSDANGQPCFIGTDWNVNFYNCKGVKTGAGSQSDGTIFSCTVGGSVINCYAEVNDTGASRWITAGNDGLINVVNGVVCYCVAQVTGVPLSTANPFSAIRIGANIEHTAGAWRNICFRPDDEVADAQIAGIVCDGLATSDSGGYHVHFNTIFNFRTGILITNAGAGGTVGTSSYSSNLIVGCPDAVHNLGTSESTLPTHWFFATATDGTFGGVGNIDTVRLTADPFTDVANADFSLNSVQGGGEACRARAADATGGTPDIGAIQA